MHTWLIIVARVVLSGVLVPAVAAKLGRTSRLIATVRAWRIGPPELARPVGSALAVVEFTLLLGLSSGVALRIAAIATAVIFAAIAASAASVLARGISANCGCFKSGQQERVTTATVLRAAAVAILAGLIVSWSGWSLRPAPRWSVSLVVLVLPLCVVVIRRLSAKPRLSPSLQPS